jgi:pimeloyl-ACP methyl ester carboxylesterase/DNA-binding CsgD family transcriptional regulator
MVFIPGWVSHVELEMENPLARSFYERLASFTRLIRFDKRGTGMSDRDLATPGIQERANDIAAVMAAAGSQRAVLFGFSEGGAMASVFAARHPERVERLVLYGSHAGRVAGATDFPCGYESHAAIDWMHSIVEGHWGEGATLERLAPSMWTVPGAREWMAHFERLAATPGAALSHFDFNRRNDVRHVLADIETPTLVIQRRGDHFVPPCNARFLADHIVGSKLVILDGDDHLPYVGDPDAIIAEVAQFITGRRNGPWDQNAPPPAAVAGVELLTPAQLRVARLVADGLGNGEIAARLGISRHTVESHLKQIFQRLGLRSRVELARVILREHP